MESYIGFIGTLQNNGFRVKVYTHVHPSPKKEQRILSCSMLIGDGVVTPPNSVLGALRLGLRGIVRYSLV